MAGWGRNISVYEQHNPAQIDIVDINSEMTKKAKDFYPNINAYTSELTTWCYGNFTKQYDIIFAIWTLTYLDKKGIDYFFNWFKYQKGLLVLVEPFTLDKTLLKKEKWLDFNQ